MRSHIISRFFLGIFTLAATFIPASEGPVNRLTQPPERNERHGEIITQYNDQLPPLWNKLTPEERVFAYYMTRASIPGNRIYADQAHRHALAITDLFTHLMAHEEAITKTCASSMDTAQFMQEVKEFSVYLFAHHSQYFVREFEDHKRTPERLNLSLLTPANLTKALLASGEPSASHVIEHLHESLFNAHHEPTLSVDGSIEKSAMNMYGPNFTQQDYDTLSAEDKNSLITYFHKDPIYGLQPTIKHRIGEHYSAELEVVYYWLEKAYLHASRHPHIFSNHTASSLAHMINFLFSGDEKDFKNFYKEWIKIKDRVSFNIGFPETYLDPKKIRGAFRADVTIQTIDMAKLNALLPNLEKKLPFPQEYMRQNLDDTSAIPNAAVYTKIFASGECGPIKHTAAYKLPNYDDISEQYGSRQIIYQQQKNPATNPLLGRRLFMSSEHADWLDTYDKEREFEDDLWDIRVLLHETLGHGSGRLAQHTFVEGDPLEIDNKRYAIGDTAAVTGDNVNQLLGKDSASLEELRADIIGLYTSIFSFDELAAGGLYKNWPARIGKEKLTEWFITFMAQQGLRRLLVQKDNATEVVQAHARANNTILNYLTDHGGLKIVEQTYPVNNVPHTVVDVHITDRAQAMDAVKALAILVQRISSTADGQALTKLMQRYGAPIRKPEYIKILKTNRTAAQGNLKDVAEIYPRLISVTGEGTIKDISAEWPESFLEQQLELNRLELEKE